MAQTKWKRGLGTVAVLAAVTLLVGLLWPTSNSVGDETASADSTTTTTSTTEPTPQEDAKECPNTWKIVQSDNQRNRWFADGIQEIKNADTPAKAREAANTWLRLVRRDPQLLAGAATYFLDRQVEWGTLLSEPGKCASEAAEMLTAEIELAIADAKVEPDQAPSNGVNSGVNADGNVVAASQNGITGDRSAVRVETKDGVTIWIMARCGNPVVTEKPKIPEGPTDNPTTTTTTSTTTTTLAPKDPTKSVDNSNEVTPQVHKDEPSVDNQTEAEKDSVTPTDSPTGCDGPCSEDPTFEDPPTTTTTTTTRPSNPSTTTTTQPSCGQAGQPSCDNTGVNPPPTTQPPAPPPEDQPPVSGEYDDSNI